MASIKLTMKDGSIKNFPHEGRPGGSYTKELILEGAFAVVKDEWGNQTIFPVQDIEKIETQPGRGNI